MYTEGKLHAGCWKRCGIVNGKNEKGKGRIMEKELLGKFASDGNFVEFCKMVDRRKERGERIRMPFETASMLFGAGVAFVEGENNLDAVHQAVKRFLESPFAGEGFHEYFIARCMEGLERDSGG